MIPIVVVGAAGRMGRTVIETTKADPVFFLNHCNVDRIWAAWQAAFPASTYLPDGTVSVDLKGHRIDDEMHALLSSPAPVTSRARRTRRSTAWPTTPWRASR